ncbi:MAG: hypothetical protein NC432_05995 [Roseburia sp.]|nr:hypothetical protein [Roseburia sp.]MCM1098857.1 hypothetical protein [Ruminococcus flavefaciens]
MAGDWRRKIGEDRSRKKDRKRKIGKKSKKKDQKSKIGKERSEKKQGEKA